MVRLCAQVFVPKEDLSLDVIKQYRVVSAWVVLYCWVLHMVILHCWVLPLMALHCWALRCSGMLGSGGGPERRRLARPQGRLLLSLRGPVWTALDPRSTAPTPASPL